MVYGGENRKVLGPRKSLLKLTSENRKALEMMFGFSNSRKTFISCGIKYNYKTKVSCDTQ